MAVLCRQTAEGMVTQVSEIARHTPKQSDAALLRAKAKGAEEKGWTVEGTGKRAFTATKIRWGGVLCTREFWAD